MASIHHLDHHHKALFSEEIRRKLSFALLSLTGVACITLLFLLGRSL